MISRIVVILFILLLGVNLVSGQLLDCSASDWVKSALIGEYNTKNASHTSKKHYEEIMLNADSTFKYFSRMGDFIRLSVEGKWTVCKDTLILYGDHSGKDKMEVRESYSEEVSPGWVKYSVNSFDGTPLNYQVTAVHGDTSITIKNRFASTMVPLSMVDEFFIDGSLYRYPVYQVKKTESNLFEVKVSSKRLFIEEKWLIQEAGIIRPIGLDGQYATYYLSRAENTE